MSNYKFKNIKVLNKKEEAALLTLAQSGNAIARKELVEKNLKFVIKVAFEFKAIVNPDELIGEGVLGLDHAIEEFETDRGLKFITFAVWWIRAFMTQYLKDKKSMIRIPVNKQVEIRDAVKADKITPEIQKFLNLKSRGVALDKPISGEGVSTFQDLLADPDTSKVPGAISDLDTMSFVKSLLARLPAIESRILIGLFGIDADGKMTLRELADDLSISHERVRQLKNQALHRISKFDDAADILDNYLEAFGS